MTGREIAEWLGIKYSTYSRNPNKYLAHLEGYCEFEKVWGGVNILEIFIPEYNGDISSKLAKIYIQEIVNSETKLSSAAGLARKLKAFNDDYKDMKLDTLEYQIRKVGNITFGKTNYINKGIDFENKGTHGYRFGVWAIKVNDFNLYRHLTQEELDVFDRIIKDCYANRTPEDIKKLAMLDRAFKKNEISKDEYFAQKELLPDDFSNCLRAFRAEIGEQIARVQEHEITDITKEEIEEMRALRD